jgi:hypothetical protein
VIDLGVGLIFFLFILHFSIFLKHKTRSMVMTQTFIWLPTSVIFVLGYFSQVMFPFSPELQVAELSRNLLLLSWYDYYDLFVSTSMTDLNLIREIYFFNNSWEFVAINFMLLYGILTAILLMFLIQKTFNFLNSTFSVNTPNEKTVNASFFIRGQNFATQQQMSTGTRVWQTSHKTS